ncbi:MAG: hypothetical protein JWO83_4858 [Caulobacteraceae bacterium]|nr:hypothetical protein [Caulobacteraceae bacterium]
MPLLWLALGLIVVLVFTLLLMARSPSQSYLKGPASEPVPAPVSPPPKQVAP